MSFQRLAVVVGVWLGVVAAWSCGSETPSTAECLSDPDCPLNKVCQASKCVPKVAMETCTAGQTRPCGPEPVGECKKGVQNCVNGAFETTCTGQVEAVAETCNGLDDDCDGTTDEDVATTYYLDSDGDGFGAAAQSQLACAQPAGHVTDATDCDDTQASVNPMAQESCSTVGVDDNCNGTPDEGCGCTNVGSTRACCSGRGTQTCQASGNGATYSACSVMPTPETCNGLDDDCDGQVDEGISVMSADGGTLSLPDGGVVASDGTCAAGQGVCRRSAMASCTGGALVCSVTPGTPSTETCNGLDDDCDGQVDDGISYAGAGGFSLPDGGLVASDGTCAAGLGVCRRTALATCSMGAVSCTATPGTAGTETCNGLDDDCDGQVDDGISFTGVTTPLADGGVVASDGTCAAGLGLCRRTAAATCTQGAVSCVAVAGTPTTEVCNSQDDDCDGVVDNGVRVTCYPDPDNDGWASDATASSQCRDNARASAGYCPSGYVGGSTPSVFDCAPNNAGAWRTVATRTDTDSDGYCSGATTNECIGTTALMGRRIATSCNATDDCNDANSALYQTYSLRADADGDGACWSPASTQCLGSTIPNGYRLASSCSAEDDCDDTTATLYRTMLTRADADGDSFCAGTNAYTCVGASAPAGRRFSSACSGDDCRDTNPYATTTCSFTYTTFTQSKTCAVGTPATETFNVTGGCGTGYSPINFAAAEVSNGNIGNCSATAGATIQMTCEFAALGTFQCNITGTCQAN